MFKYILLLAAFCCADLISQVNMQNEIEALKQADRDFSAHSEAKGMTDAFMAYVAPDGVLLRSYTDPVVGAEEIKKFVSSGTEDYTLTWTPLFGDVSLSGELGYTYGSYILKIKSESGEPKILEGTYVTVWKKDSAGKWKWVLDNGNLGKEKKQE